ncbi:peptidase inhibitor family I36 protein [Streptomyces sp. NPDC016562]|uniref:peptidase inhibitor family I36 protein n=1 Tax=Streptomyces sp. NPDC016562 TaxID=3364966 RepID=UPI0036F775F1
MRTCNATPADTARAGSTSRVNTTRVSTVLAVTALALSALIPSTATTAHAAGPPALGPCATGQLCLWAKPDFKGARQTHELSTLDVNSCIALPAGTTAQSLTNRTGRPVTTYQSDVCAETGEFQTYPGDGVWLPQSPYQVRAFKVWEN